MAGSLIPTAAQDGDGAMPSAPPKLGGGAKSKNQLRRMKAKAKKIADQGIDKTNDISAENADTDEQIKEEDDVAVSTVIELYTNCADFGLTVTFHRFVQMPASSSDSISSQAMLFDPNDPAMAMFSSVFEKFQGDGADQIMSDEAVSRLSPFDYPSLASH